MLIFRIVGNRETNWLDNIAYFWLSSRMIDGDTREKDLILLRDDYKFALSDDVIYRVCEIDLDDVLEGNLSFRASSFIKVWVKDPFISFEEYEQIHNVFDVSSDYCI